jgi:hypothetical protein
MNVTQETHTQDTTVKHDWLTAKLLLAFASTVIHGSESHRTHGPVLLYCQPALKALQTHSLPLKREMQLHNIYISSSYLTRNTVRLRYKAQPVNAVQGNSRCLL